MHDPHLCCCHLHPPVHLGHIVLKVFARIHDNHLHSCRQYPQCQAACPQLERCLSPLMYSRRHERQLYVCGLTMARLFAGCSSSRAGRRRQCSSTSRQVLQGCTRDVIAVHEMQGLVKPQSCTHIS